MLHAHLVPIPVAADFPAVGDFDGDGRLDVLAAGREGNQLSLASGDGQGGFSGIVLAGTGSQVERSMPGFVTASLELSEGTQVTSYYNYGPM